MDPPSTPAASLVADFLADLAATNHAPQTRRAYATDLAGFVRWYSGAAADITAAVLGAYLTTVSHLRPASRARKQAALASWLAWAERHERIATNPMPRVSRVRVPSPVPRGLPRAQVETILQRIPPRRRRDRLLFRLLLETGLRPGEALGLYVEDVDLRPDDEHLRVHGKGDRVRTVLRDDAGLVRQLRRYLQQAGYRHGPLFRAEKNGRGGPLRYQSAQARWAQYCAAARIACTLQQLRHTHATELVNGGVSLATIRKRLGHRHLQTTLRYAEQSDDHADAEVRAWRRQRDRVS
jgi:integrase/recombinase XerD